MFNIISRRTLLRYAQRHPSAATALYRWYAEMLHSASRNFNELRTEYPDLSIVGDDRVVFNIMGNRYRLVVRIVFDYRVLQIKWFGTHHEYDRINVATIQH
ncbi:MAG: type II toxin-antitoxin system HigB family toxin [Candidatus Kapabacteria bacterium]|nr:type II toxin-antitoxin system HigB family toxin [Candidatus Kapabacteria bacterium]